MTPRILYFCLASIIGSVVLFVSACSNNDQNLWSREFPKEAAVRTTSPPQVTGYWEGEVTMGGVRTRIEPDRITMAFRCDTAGKILSQGSAPIAFQKGERPKIVLQADLSGGTPEWCGFRFYKGNEFGYTLGDDGTLKVNFAGASVSQLHKLAE